VLHVHRGVIRFARLHAVTRVPVRLAAAELHIVAQQQNTLRTREVCDVDALVTAIEPSTDRITLIA